MGGSSVGPHQCGPALPGTDHRVHVVSASSSRGGGANPGRLPLAGPRCNNIWASAAELTWRWRPAAASGAAAATG
eukprot:86118-Chlamydomonas_euryale.AAC.1